MSRGLGNVEQFILTELCKGGSKEAIELACLMRGGQTCTEAEAVSVRRALRGLQRKGKVASLGHLFRGGRKKWALPEVAQRYRDRYEAVFGEKL